MQPRIVAHAACLTALLAATLLAGCLGGADAPPPGDAAGTRTGPPLGPLPVTAPTPASEPGASPGASDPVALRFPLAAAIDHEVTRTGTFTARETGAAGGFATGDFVHHVDLSAEIPADVPARIDVTVTLDADTIPIVGPTARADPIANGTVWYTSYWNHDAPGVFTMGGLVKRSSDGTMGVALEAYTPGPNEPPEVDYTVHARVVARPDAIPVGVPVAVALEGGDTLELRTDATQQAEVLVYGAHDVLLDRVFLVGGTEWTVPSDRGGELVLVPILGADRLQVLLEPPGDAAPPRMRALDVVHTTGDPHELTPAETASWGVGLDKRPLRLLVTVVGPANEPWTCVGGLEVEVEGPAGQVIGATADCPSPTNVPFLYEERRTWSTQPGDARLGPGDYAIRIDNTLWTGHQAFHTIETYQR